jgi:hypothetical protein
LPRVGTLGRPFHHSARPGIAKGSPGRPLVAPRPRARRRSIRKATANRERCQGTPGPSGAEGVGVAGEPTSRDPADGSPRGRHSPPRTRGTFRAVSPSAASDCMGCPGLHRVSRGGSSGRPVRPMCSKPIVPRNRRTTGHPRGEMWRLFSRHVFDGPGRTRGLGCPPGRPHSRSPGFRPNPPGKAVRWADFVSACIEPDFETRQPTVAGSTRPRAARSPRGNRAVRLGGCDGL